MSRRSRHGRRPPLDSSPQIGHAQLDVGAATSSPRQATDAALARVLPDAAHSTEAPSSVRPGRAAAVEPAPVEAREPAAQGAPAAPSVPTGSDDAAGLTPGDGDTPRTTCTQAQLRRFIKSRPWIPMHELRRRFGIYGDDDGVTPVSVASGTIFVGLPPVEGRMLGELLSSGDVGYELSLDPCAPIVVGVYPMRPVPRG